jgi:hypothetical protein
MSECRCPNCLQRIPNGTLADWIALYTKTRLTPCAGTVDGHTCGELLTARQMLRPCPKCGGNNWKVVEQQKREAMEADAISLPHE